MTTITRTRSGAVPPRRFSALALPPPWIVLSILGTALLACGIVVSTLWSQSRAASGIAYWDQWAWIPQYRRIVEHGLTLDELMQQNNEHRLVFPRLVFLLDMAWAGGSDRLNLLSSDALQGFTLATLVWMARQTLWTSLGIVATCCSAALLGNAIQAQNFYWGFQVQFVMVHTAAVMAFALLSISGGRRPVTRLYLVSSWASATVATFSMANGIAVWPIMSFVLLMQRRPLAALCTFMAGTIEFGAYLHGYRAVASAEHTGVAQAVAHPLACLSYFLTYLGGILAPTHPELALIGGVIMLAAAGRLAWWARRSGAGGGSWRHFALAVFLFVVLSALVTAIGRFTFGGVQALSSRYMTPGALLWSTLLMALAAETRNVPSRRWHVVACVVMATVAIPILVLDQAHGLGDLDQTTRRMRAAADAYTLGIRDDAAMSAVTSDDALAWSVRPFLAAHRLGPFSGDAARRLGSSIANRYEGRSYGPCTGSIDEARSIGPPDLAGLRFSGWAWSGTDGLPSGLIVANADGTIVGFARIGEDRREVTGSQPNVTSGFTGFTGYVPGHPAGPLRVFVVSRDGRKLCLLDEMPG